MKFSDEMLMAYADGELDLVARAEIEAAMTKDPAVAAAIERHRRLAARVKTAYEGVIDETVPERLASLVPAPAAIPLREAVATAGRRGDRRAAVRNWRIPQWAALAASVAVAFFAGVLLARGPGAPYEESDAGLIARGELDEALTLRVASAAGESNVRLGMTFRDRGGDFCRTFHMERDTPLAGLACRSGEQWKIEVLAAARSHQGDLRPAAAMPMAVLHTVDATIEGEPLDAAAEAEARNSGWRKR